MKPKDIKKGTRYLIRSSFTGAERTGEVVEVLSKPQYLIRYIDGYGYAFPDDIIREV